jgi:ribose transport system permease protein
MAARIGAIDPSVGPSFLLPPYAAAFLGTTTIQIGRFNVVGTVIASYFLTVGVTGLLLAGASPWVSDVFNGGALLAAVTFAKLASKNDPQ